MMQNNENRTHYVSDQIAEGPRTRVIHILAKQRTDPKCGNAWVAHALELDLVAVDDGEWQSISKLAMLIQAQIDFGVKNKNEAHIPFPAPPEYFAELPCSAATRETRGTPPPKHPDWISDVAHTIHGAYELHLDTGVIAKPSEDAIATTIHVAYANAAERGSQPVAPPPPRPKIICLCGSTKFIEMFAVKTWELELEGNIVLGCTLLPKWYCPVRDHFAEALGVKDQRDNHHLQKIDLADEILVLNVNGYIGESTRREIEYAEAHGKPVKYLVTNLEASAAPAGTQPAQESGESEHGPNCFCNDCYSARYLKETGASAGPAKEGA
jgi:hypothetical protein